MKNSQKFRGREPIGQWEKRIEVIEAVQIVDTDEESNVDELIEWCGGERAVRPGYAIAFKAWTCTWQIAKPGDWIGITEQGTFRAIPADELDRAYEPL